MVKQWLCFQTWSSTPQNSNKSFLLTLPTNPKVETFCLNREPLLTPIQNAGPARGVYSTVGKEQMGWPSLASFLCSLQK